MKIEFTGPDKVCPKCGDIIPVSGYEHDVFGNDIVDDGGRAVHHKTAMLICVKCAIAAAPPKPPRKRRKKGEVDENQLSLCDRPDLKYTGLPSGPQNE